MKYVALDESLTLPRLVEDVADEVIACVKTRTYFDLDQQAELGQRITRMCQQLYSDGILPASVAIALEKGLCGLLNDGY